MHFEPGQQVIWSYRSQQTPQQIWLVAGEVVQSGHLRVRIRVRDRHGNALYRWVKPSRLRLKQPDEPVRFYPADRKQS
jgi:hypothetical protein